MKTFPEGFLWGAASASYQVEGGNENTDWAEAAREGRVPACGLACDHYHRFAEDFDMAKSLGHTAHRFSVEWARIEPEEGKFDVQAMEHYREIIRALKARGLRPFVTIWHFTLPLWLAKKGGFESKEIPALFARYAAHVAGMLGDECCFSTINEPEVFLTNGWLRGTWPPFKRFTLLDLVRITNSGRAALRPAEKGFAPLFTYLRVRNILAQAHCAAYDAIKKVRPDAEVNIVRDVIVFKGGKNPLSHIVAWCMNQFWTHAFQRKLKGKYDSIGLNYYFYKQFGDRTKYQKTDTDWDIRAEGIYDALMILARYKKPLFVSEAGIADAKDDRRADYIKKQVEGTWRAIQDGADVRGHFYWSLTDNYEWALGYTKRFGLIEIDYDTLERKIRPSAFVYKGICESNGLT